MKLRDFLPKFNRKGSDIESISNDQEAKIKRNGPNAYFGGYMYDYAVNLLEDYGIINAVPFDGEKTPYELGEPLDYKPDYHILRMRAWESFLKEDSIQNGIKKYCLWIVGAGLKLQSEPVKDILTDLTDIQESELIEFTKKTESFFRLFAEMKQSVWSNEYCLHEEGSETLKNAIIAGDILCINRFDGKYPTIETIDGRHIITPIASEFIEQAKNRGNRIFQGVEIDKRDRHIAYYVRKENYEFIRVPAYGEKSGMRLAWLFYGQKFRKNDIRGMSLLTAVMETSAMLDRYKSATLGNAEENAKVPYTIEHNQYSDGSNPFIDQMAQSFGKGKGVDPETITMECEAKATKIAQVTKKMAINMPPGAKLERHAGSTDSNFKDFFGINSDFVYSTIGVPPEVAKDKYEGSYSSSRAALKSWEYKMFVDRIKLMKRQFYKPFYSFWLDINILNNKITAPGYLEALEKDDHIVLEAYRNSRFIGANVPHIDPLKEVLAMRKKLGDRFKDVPLDSMEKIMEELGSGDLETLYNKIENESEIFKDFINTAGSPPVG